MVHNGIDLERWQPVPATPACSGHSASTPTGPVVVFVGRITRQKGLIYLLRAAEHLPADVQLVLCAGAAGHPGDLRTRCAMP